MFTGIITDTAVFSSLKYKNNFNRLELMLPDIPDPVVGESVSVDGVCLTLTGSCSNFCYFDISDETVSGTTITFKRKGDVLNIERSLKLGERMGGHFVYGHVDCVGKVQGVIKQHAKYIIKISLSEPGYLIPKGSIAINGVSLTISKILSNSLFEVSVIPETLKRTNLGVLKFSHRVNIEFDMLVKAKQ